MWPFTKMMDHGYKTVETIDYSNNYAYASIAGVSPLNIEYSVTAVVLDREEFANHELLDDKKKDEYIKTFIDLKIYDSLAPYHVVFDDSERYNFHKILKMGLKKPTISENPEQINTIISKIESNVNGSTSCGLEFTRFNFVRARKYMLPMEELIEKAKKMKGRFVPFNEMRAKGITVYNSYDINVAVLAFDDYVHIQWETGWATPSGTLKIYRRTGVFAQDKISETDNLKMVVDSSEKNNVFIDEGSELVRGTTYYYTVDYRQSESKLFQEQLSTFRMAKRVHKDLTILHIAKFAVMLPE